MFMSDCHARLLRLVRDIVTDICAQGMGTKSFEDLGLLLSSFSFIGELGSGLLPQRECSARVVSFNCPQLSTHLPPLFIPAVLCPNHSSFPPLFPPPVCLQPAFPTLLFTLPTTLAPANAHTSSKVTCPPSCPAQSPYRVPERDSTGRSGGIDRGVADG